MFSRRSLFRYAAGGLAVGSARTVAGKSAGSFSSSSAGLSASAPEAHSNSVQPGAPGSPVSFRLAPASSTPVKFGRVKDFWSHIEDRPDIKRETLYWLTDGRASFLGAASRYQYLAPAIRPLYEKAGIPVEFGFGVGMQESLFRNYSVSYANAKGIWQMQWAGKRYGLQGGDYFDVVRSTEKQLEYLTDLMRDFDWNLELVLVDYNYGPGKTFARYRSDEKAFQRIYNRIPAETKRYVPRVLSAIAIGMAPEKYGMYIPEIDPTIVDVKVPRSMHHLELGLLLGTDHWNIGNLNPRENIRVWFEEGEQVRIPRSLEAAYSEQIEGHPLKEEFHAFISEVYPAPGDEITYVVQSGDNLSKIASRFRECGVQGIDHIMLYNGLSSTVIRPGQVLLIPCGR